MASNEPVPALLIPGPILVDDEVLSAAGAQSVSHMSMGFVNVFGETLELLRKLFGTSDPASQPIVLSGSGTLGWDLVAANIVEAGDDVLVLHAGYFADSFADCFSTYGVKATQLKAPIGASPSLDDIEKALKEKKYKAITITHVDTSTAVLSNPKKISELVHKVSPETLVIVDGVCSVGCEELYFDDWGLDAVLTASQKGIGCPPGLMIAMLGKRAMESYKNRKGPPGSYYASLKNWLPIMQSHEARKPAYFATPAVQSVTALHASLKQILSRPISERFEKHRQASKQMKDAVTELGLKQLASNPEYQANVVTAMYLPEGMKPTDILPILLKKGVTFAGGLQKEVATKYIRCGLMGNSVTKNNDVEKAISALKEALSELGYNGPS